MRVALVHDDLVQWGGAEKVLATLAEIFPDAPIYTSLYDPGNSLIHKNFSSKKIITSFLQQIPSWRDFYKILLPFYPIAFEQFDFSDFDLVISQTTRFANSLIVKPGTTHICYSHTPPRFLWNFSRFQINPLVQGYFSFLRVYDQVVSHRVDHWLSGSKNVQQKINKIYHQKSVVLYPFIDYDFLTREESYEGGYFLVISRLNSYKRVDLVVSLATKESLPLKIVGIGPQEDNLKRIAGPTVEFLGQVDDLLLRKVLAGAKALVICAEEDFGLTSLEAQALGKPVVAYGRGGALETVIEGKTGYFFYEQTTEALKFALDKLTKESYNKKMCLSNSANYSKEKFLEKFADLIRDLV